MTELNFLYVEDDTNDADKLVKFVTKYFEKNGYRVYFWGYDWIPDRVEFESLDACFLDIEIGDKNTLPLMKQIRDNFKDIPIIPVSNYDNYVFDTLDFHIFDFIRKAYFNDQMLHTLTKLKLYFDERVRMVLTGYNNSLIKLYIKDIIYIQFYSHYFVVYTEEHGALEVWKDYDDVFNKPVPYFVKTHKSYLININHCYRIDKKNAYLREADKPISISKRNYKIVLEYFTNFNSFLA